MRGCGGYANQWPDDVRLSDLEPKFTYQACGRRGLYLEMFAHR
jgi:hypothetical protein